MRQLDLFLLPQFSPAAPTKKTKKRRSPRRLEVDPRVTAGPGSRRYARLWISSAPPRLASDRLTAWLLLHEDGPETLFGVHHHWPITGPARERAGELAYIKAIRSALDSVGGPTCECGRRKRWARWPGIRGACNCDACINCRSSPCVCDLAGMDLAGLLARRRVEFGALLEPGPLWEVDERSRYRRADGYPRQHFCRWCLHGHTLALDRTYFAPWLKPHDCRGNCERPASLPVLVGRSALGEGLPAAIGRAIFVADEAAEESDDV